MSFRNRNLRSEIIVIEMQHFRETGSGILIVLSKHETLLKTGCSIPEKQASDNYVTINIKYIKRGFRFSGNVLPQKIQNRRRKKKAEKMIKKQKNHQIFKNFWKIVKSWEISHFPFYLYFPIKFSIRFLFFVVSNKNINFKKIGNLAEFLLKIFKKFLSNFS